MTKNASIAIRSLKITVPLAADALPRDLVPMDGPAGEPTIELVLDGGLTVQARINGKNYRKMLKQIDEHGAENVSAILQGVVRAPAAPGRPLQLVDAGFAVSVKTPKPAAVPTVATEHGVA